MSAPQLFWFVLVRSLSGVKKYYFAALLRHLPRTVERKPVCCRIDCEIS